MFLDDIAASVLTRVENRKRDEAYAARIRSVPDRFAPKSFAFEKALRAEGLSLIAEIKKASPSKGVIAEDFPFLKIAAEYEAGGADALSVLTEPDFFLGDPEHLAAIKARSAVPVLQKDFILDEFQIYEAAAYGADAILLICAILGREQIARFLRAAGVLGITCLAETRSEREIAVALECGASVIGVNSRDLRTFKVDPDIAARLARFVPDDVVFVAESGISGSEDIAFVRGIGADAALVGESLMRSADRTGLLQKMKAAGAAPRGCRQAACPERRPV